MTADRPACVAIASEAATRPDCGCAFEVEALGPQSGYHTTVQGSKGMGNLGQACGTRGHAKSPKLHVQKVQRTSEPNACAADMSQAEVCRTQGTVTVNRNQRPTVCPPPPPPRGPVPPQTRFECDLPFSDCVCLCVCPVRVWYRMVRCSTRGAERCIQCGLRSALPGLQSSRICCLSVISFAQPIYPPPPCPPQEG